jgi:hypothetical protein
MAGSSLVCSGLVPSIAMGNKMNSSILMDHVGAALFDEQ